MFWLEGHSLQILRGRNEFLWRPQVSPAAQPGNPVMVCRSSSFRQKKKLMVWLRKEPYTITIVKRDGSSPCLAQSEWHQQRGPGLKSSPAMCGGRASLFSASQKRQGRKKGPKHFREPVTALVQSCNPAALRKRDGSLTPLALEQKYTIKSRLQSIRQRRPRPPLENPKVV